MLTDVSCLEKVSRVRRKEATKQLATLEEEV